MKNVYFPIKLLKSEFMANVKWREEPVFWHVDSHLLYNIPHLHNIKLMKKIFPVMIIIFRISSISSTAPIHLLLLYYRNEKIVICGKYSFLTT